jgi:hypothetical protein
MGYYDNLLNLISVVLALSILFIIIFGCQFRKQRHIERFTNEEKEKSSNEKKEETTVPPSSSPPPPPPKSDNNDELPPFEKEIFDGLKSGTLTEEQMQKLIDDGKFSRRNLETMIDYIDKYKK